MMHRGNIVIDAKGKEREELDSTDKLMQLFEKVHIKDELSDRTLFV